MKKQLGILAVLLAAVAAGSLGVWALCRGPIARNEQSQLAAAMQAVLPGAGEFTPVALEEADDDGETETLVESVWLSDKGYAIEAEAYGYHDELRVMVGVQPDGKVVGLQLLENHETPGLGRQARWDRAFLSQFLGTAGNAALDENIDALSGATVTTKALVKAINAASGYVTGADAASGATEWGD